MEYKSPFPPRPPQRSRRFKIGVAAAVGLVITLAIVIPIAILLPKRKTAHPKCSILLPLYIYPSDGAWDPVYQAAQNYPTLNFTVIVNPNSGPGSLPYPNEDYTPAIQKLNTFANIRTIGYVKTGYGTRNVTDIVQDIRTYSGWARNSTSIAMHGIFFDEVVYEYSSSAPQYMKTIDQAAKNASGLLGSRTVVHNPGTVQDSRLLNTITDITVVFEESYQTYQSRQKTLAALPSDRSAYSYMVHSLPTSFSSSDMDDFVDLMSDHAEFLFLTNLSEDYYADWGSSWFEFIKAIAK